MKLNERSTNDIRQRNTDDKSKPTQSANNLGCTTAPQLTHRCDEYFIKSLKGAETKHSGNRLSVVAPQRSSNKQRSSIADWTKRYATILIMAWWCFSADNCVKVKGQELACPNDCDCYKRSKQILCENRSLRTLPPGLSAVTLSLSLNNNNIRDLPRNAFRRLANLRTLSLRGNFIREISSSALYGLSNLQTLDLSENKLSQIPRQSLAYLGSLRQLNLRNNPITHIIAYDFVAVRRTLRVLDIGELRHLTYVSTQALNGLDSLETLRMDSCNLKEVPSLAPLINVKEVDLSSNSLPSIRSQSFPGLEKLVTLSLAYSDVTGIEQDAFRQMTSLQVLNIGSNNLSTLPADIFRYNPRLRAIMMANNPWLCNCDLMQLAEYIEDRRICTTETCPKCRYPENYTNMPVSNLTRMNDQPCVARIMKSPPLASMNVSVGEPIKLPCPTATPNQNSGDVINWKLPSGKPLQHGKYKVRIKMLGNGALNFTKVTLTDKGVYTCSISRSGNEIAQSTVYLNVTKPSDVVTMTYFTTETTVLKPTSRIIQVQNPTPPTITKAKITKATNRRVTSRATTSSPPSVKTLFVPPAFEEPKPSMKTTRVTKNINRQTESVDQVMATTKIIIGCFVGLTIVAAAILIIFYKLRKRSHSEAHRNGGGIHKYGNEKDKKRDHEEEQIPLQIEQMALMKDPPYKPPAPLFGTPTPWLAALSPPNEAPPPMTSRHAPLISSCDTDCRFKNVHVLPPPPEETMMSMTSAFEQSKSQYPIMTSRPSSTLPSSNNRFTSSSSKQFLNNIALSCQQVALQKQNTGENRDVMQRQSISEEYDVTTRNDTKYCVKPLKGEAVNNNRSRNNNGPRYHKSCENILKSMTLSRQSNDHVVRDGDIDFSKGYATMDHVTGRRKIPIRMKSMEGLLNHKETKI